ncbi:MAG TPA: hypothetical protein VML50_17080 [Anaeromyxobacter sp.]|nr:hypothetical protein [Anaeromyxobacter sp.]
MAPRTRLDRLVSVRERSEDSALETLSRAQRGVARATERLAGLRETARADRRQPGVADLWAVEEIAHIRVLRAVEAAEGDVAKALRTERAAQSGYVDARRSAEVVRRAQEKKRAELRDDRERRERKALDELATLAFNSRR